MAVCRGCEKQVDDAAAEELCAECREALGMLATELPVLRPAGPCRRCDGPEIVQALMRERGASGVDYVREFLRPLSLTHGVVDQRAFWSNRKKGVTPDIEVFQGALVAYACRSCGYTEFYTLGAAELPIGPEHGTTLLRYDGGPYR